MKKFFAVLLVLILVLACFAGCKGHECANKCAECGKCTNTACTEKACADKCAGHHVCESKCPECGKCLDAACTEAACADKCAGHVPPHTCESVCDQCGKCLDAECTEDACKDKCAGHHECANKCPLCKKCVNADCADPACADKCKGHTYADKAMILLATADRNFRSGAIAEMYCIAEDMPFVLELPEAGKPVDFLMGDYANYKGGAIDKSLAGGPVLAVVADDRWIVEFKELPNTLELCPYEVTVVDGKYMYNGEELKLAEELFTAPANCSIYYSQCISPRAGKAVDDATWGLVSGSDDDWTLFDTNGDGTYDFSTIMPYYNAGTIVNIKDNRIYIQGSFGSTNSMYWTSGAVDFDYEFVCEPWDLKVGDIIDYTMQYNLNCQPAGNGATALALIHGKVETQKGIMQAVETVDGVINVKFSGVDYQWSKFMSTGDAAADGPDGSNAGRGFMTPALVGQEFEFITDRAGKVIWAKSLGEAPKVDMPENLYVVIATWTQNMRNGSNAVAPEENSIAAVEFGKDLTAANAVILMPADGVVIETGKPYILTLDGTTVTAAEEVGKDTMVSIYASAISYDDAGTVTYGDKTLAVDSLAFATTSAQRVFGFGGVFIQNTTLAGLSTMKSDWEGMFFDLNGDSTYDYIYVWETYTGVVANVADGRVELERAVGSNGASGWFQPNNSYAFTAPEGVTFAAGDVINFKIFIDKSTSYPEGSNPNAAHAFPCEFEVLAVAEKKTGAVTDVVKADGNKTITFKLDGVEYSWSNTWNTAAANLADLENGSGAHRDTFADGTWTVFFDMAGNVVYAVQ